MSSTLHYRFTFGEDEIFTTVTSDPSAVTSWLTETEIINYFRLHHLIVGLDAEWRPSYGPLLNPVATLQLCVGNRCLIFQLIHAPFIPSSLFDFLNNQNYTFVGVGVQDDSQKLASQYGLMVCNTCELGAMAALVIGESRLARAGSKDLAIRVLGVEMDKPRHITMSQWDATELCSDQLYYATMDAFVSFEIGRSLNV